MIRILVLHGPNLNLLGSREPEVYGRMSLAEVNQRLAERAQVLGVEARALQSNHEGALIDALHDASGWAQAVIFNPGGYSHTSVALRDAVASIPIPVVEVHLSNVYAREDFRQTSLISPVCRAKIVGFGWRSYVLALEGLVAILSEQP
jgi:3-dehydroquinate dehydratase-2